MEADCIKFKDSGYFSKIILDYLETDEKLKDFYEFPPHLDAFKELIESKRFPKETRAVLAQSLIDQYKKGGISFKKDQKVKANIELLREDNTFTVTTGHQLCLFTGPLYFIYKIVSVISLAQRLKKEHPKQNFVPIYWMATEDHDFAEINHFRFKGKKIEWNTNQKGAVGRMGNKGLDAVFQEFESLIADYSTHGEQLKSLFKKAYLEKENLADASRYLVNELFKEFGVVVLDGDDSALKSVFASTVKKELLTEFSSHAVQGQSEKLAEHYKIQVNPREINLFYLKDGLRERIVKAEKQYLINDTDLTFSEEEILQELKNYPERFSPNVLLRPVYQETILPNLAYIGGGGELAYWFQLKTVFESVQLQMPMLLLRNSALWMDEKQLSNFKDLNLSNTKLFLREGDLLKDWVVENSKQDLKLSQQKHLVEQLHQALAAQASEIDTTLEPHVKAIAAKQIKELDKLSNQFIRAERRKADIAASKINHLKSTLFPNNGLQERTNNFAELYLVLGKEMVDHLLAKFEQPTQDFLLLRLG